jgi:hypothetical protein
MKEATFDASLSCPVCYKVWGGVSENVTGNTEIKPGYVAVCTNCRSAFKFDENLKMAMMSQKELEDLMAKVPLVWVQMQIGKAKIKSHTDQN